MSRPPKKLPMEQPLGDKPPVPGQQAGPGQSLPPQRVPQQGPGQRPPGGPQQPGTSRPGPSQPGRPRPPGNQGKSGAGTALVVILSIFGGLGLLALLVCGGFLYFVDSGVNQAAKATNEAAQAFEDEFERAQAQQAGGGSPNPPWQPPRVNSSSQSRPIDSVPRAVEAIAKNDHFRRRDALRYLKGKTPDDAQRATVVTQTLPLLSDWQLRGDAKAVLIAWASADQASQIISTADAAYARRDRDTQRNAVEVLAATGSDQAPAAIAKYYGTRHDTQAARRAFESIGASSAPHLLPFVNDPDGGLRQTARDLLTTWKVEEATLAAQGLVDLQSGDDNRAREAANWFASHVIVDEELTPKVSAALISLLTNRNVRASATSALNFWASADSVPALVDAARVAHAAEDHDTEKACVLLLTGLNDERALPTYSAYLDTRHDLTTAKAAFAAIGENSAKSLLPFIHHEDHRTREVAHELLAEWEIEKSHWLTQSMVDLRSENENRRRQAVRYLVDTEPDESVQSGVAMSLLTLVDDQRLRHDALRALKVWATSETVPQLIELLDHEDGGVRNNARSILVATKDPRAVKPIAAGFGEDFFKRIEARKALVAMGPVAESAFWPHVTHKDWRIAKDAVEALGDIGTAKSIPVLEAAVAQDSHFVKGAAQNAIKKIEEAKREPGPMPTVVEAGPVDDGTRKMRTWTDASGGNTIEALFIEFKLGKVRLRTSDGKFLSLKLDQLSAADRQYVIDQVQRK